MEPKIIGVRELHYDLKKITLAMKRGRSFLVKNHKEVLFRIEPAVTQKKHVGKSILKDFEDMMFNHPDKNLSKKIDEIVYADRR